MMMNNNKGNAGVFIGVMFVIFIVGAIYVTMSNPWDMMYDKFNGSIAAEHKVTLDKIDNIWDLWPIYLIVVALIAGIWRLLQSQPDEGFI